MFQDEFFQRTQDFQRILFQLLREVKELPVVNDEAEKKDQLPGDVVVQVDEQIVRIDADFWRIDSVDEAGCDARNDDCGDKWELGRNAGIKVIIWLLVMGWGN